MLPDVLSRLVVHVLTHILKSEYVQARQPQIYGPAGAEGSANILRRPTVGELQEEVAHGTYPLPVACTDITRALTQGAATRPADMYGSSSPEGYASMIAKLDDLLDSHGNQRRNRSPSVGSNIFQVSKC